MKHLNEQWDSLRTIAVEMVRDATSIALTEYRSAYPQDNTVRSPHLPEAITARVMGVLDDLFYSASRILREEERSEIVEVKPKKKEKKAWA